MACVADVVAAVGEPAVVAMADKPQSQMQQSHALVGAKVPQSAGATNQQPVSAVVAPSPAASTAASTLDMGEEGEDGEGICCPNSTWRRERRRSSPGLPASRLPCLLEASGSTTAPRASSTVPSLRSPPLTAPLASSSSVCKSVACTARPHCTHEPSHTPSSPSLSAHHAFDKGAAAPVASAASTVSGVPSRNDAEEVASQDQKHVQRQQKRELHLRQQQQLWMRQHKQMAQLIGTLLDSEIERAAGDRDLEVVGPSPLTLAALASALPRRTQVTLDETRARPAQYHQYDSAETPPITTHAYALRLLSLTGASPETALLALSFIARITTPCGPTDTVAGTMADMIDSQAIASGASSTGCGHVRGVGAGASGHLKLTERNVHRLLFAAVLLAIKFQDDFHFTNVYYAKVGGLTRAEASKLEYSLFRDLDYHLNLSAPTFAHLATLASEALLLQAH